MLHLIFQSPIDVAVLDRMASGDCAVFLGSSVYGVLKNGELSDLIACKLSANPMYVLSEDMAIRGILEPELTKGLKTIDYSGLVNLTIENSLCMSWC